MAVIQTQELAPLPSDSDVVMVRDGQVTEVRNNESVAIMQALGWKLVTDAPIYSTQMLTQEAAEQIAERVESKPSRKRRG